MQGRIGYSTVNKEPLENVAPTRAIEPIALFLFQSADPLGNLFCSAAAVFRDNLFRDKKKASERRRLSFCEEPPWNAPSLPFWVSTIRTIPSKERGRFLPPGILIQESRATNSKVFLRPHGRSRDVWIKSPGKAISSPPISRESPLSLRAAKMASFALSITSAGITPRP